ncbi:MAG: hypothetical protein MHM6MM_001238 [Cercozoa sp. M6MM]
MKTALIASFLALFSALVIAATPWSCTEDNSLCIGGEPALWLSSASSEEPAVRVELSSRSCERAEVVRLISPADSSPRGDAPNAKKPGARYWKLSASADTCLSSSVEVKTVVVSKESNLELLRFVWRKQDDVQSEFTDTDSEVSGDLSAVQTWDYFSLVYVAYRFLLEHWKQVALAILGLYVLRFLDKNFKLRRNLMPQVCSCISVCQLGMAYLKGRTAQAMGNAWLNMMGGRNRRRPPSEVRKGNYRTAHGVVDMDSDDDDDIEWRPLNLNRGWMRSSEWPWKLPFFDFGSRNSANSSSNNEGTRAAHAADIEMPRRAEQNLHDDLEDDDYTEDSHLLHEQIIEFPPAPMLE